MKPLLLSSGEPAGVGPDLCLALANGSFPVVVLGDKEVLASRAKQLKQLIHFEDYNPREEWIPRAGYLNVLSIPCPNPVVSGVLNPANAPYVLELLNTGARLCSQGEFSGLVTAPVHKANINAAGIPFTGHTEFLSDFYNAHQVVMMLACSEMKVALVTTHLPLNQVAQSITNELVQAVIRQLNQSLIRDFGITKPYLKVAGLNPHAGESGYMGREEIDIITPVLEQLKAEGLLIEGPLPADTMFTKLSSSSCDAYVAMYHDQGLPVLKYAGFGRAVNVTLGLPIIRTSVDHGTALDLAGTGQADCGSLLAAVEMAQLMATMREQHEQNKSSCSSR